MVNINTFKHLCIATHSKRGYEIREYFIEIEAQLIKYKNVIIEHYKKKENNTIQINDLDNKKLIYVIAASEQYNNVFPQEKQEEHKI